MNLRLVALIQGTTKDGKKWSKISVKKRTIDGNPVLKDFYIDPNIAHKMAMERLVEDVDITVELGFDDYLRPTITGVRRAMKVD